MKIVKGSVHGPKQDSGIKAEAVPSSGEPAKKRSVYSELSPARTGSAEAKESSPGQQAASRADAGVTRVILTSKTPSALVTDEIDKESNGAVAARKAKQLDQDLKTLLKEANEVSVQKLKFYENLLGKNRDNLKLIQSTQGLGVSKSSRAKIGGLAKGFREGIDLASPCTHR